jgi:predicted NUDIX family NTP pyrophosphohydrolase
MPDVSAGILLYRKTPADVEVFLVHPGGPYWARKDEGAWSVPKGLVDSGEDKLACAWREFREETGFDGFDRRVAGAGLELGSFRLPSGKHLHIWAFEGDCDPVALRSNGFEMEWPPRSGRKQRFPEVDRGGWFDQRVALRKISPGQRAVLETFYAQFDPPQR